MVRECRVCGCTEADCTQCVKAQGYPCEWVDIDLCSRCANEMEQKESAADTDIGNILG